MIIGIGIDLIDLSRIEDILERKGEIFLTKIFTQQEIKKSPIQQKRRIEYYAGRFAAKEAVAKALGTGIGKQLGWKDVEIINEDSGRPIVEVNNTNLINDESIIHISISHSTTLAIAKVIIEQK